GDIAAEDAIAAVARSFGALPPRTQPAVETTLAKGPTFPGRPLTPVLLKHHGRADQSLALTAWPLPDFFADPQAARTMRVLEQVIALRLFDRLRGEQGLAYATETEMLSSEVFSGYGYLMAMAEVKPQDGDKVFAAISAIVADLRDREVTADELERAKRPRVEEYAAGRQTNAYWLSALAGVHEDPRRIESARTLLAQIQAVTPAALRAAAQRYLTEEKAWKAHIVPIEQSQTAAVL
ncbi:MAG TPA: insulinase family protein, partial [Thermoanaerobaculia bacterium]|nr:insulinase family protein [Thermoanaerobaculia bacterium]